MPKSIFAGPTEYSAAVRDPWIRLGAAVLVEAVTEADAGDLEAWAWLAYGDNVPLFVEPLELDPGRVRAWALAVDLCPRAKKRRCEALGGRRKNRTGAARIK